jgi:D-alanyl-D-alanine carboxypeptidase
VSLIRDLAHIAAIRKLELMMKMLSCAFAAIAGAMFASQLNAADLFLEAQDYDLDPAIESFAQRGEFSGVAMIAVHGDPVWTGTYGMASEELGVPAEAGMRYKLHSSSKPILAVAVMRAVEQGRAELDASICVHLDPCAPAWEPVTLRHLLSHTSGIPDFTNRMVDVWTGDLAGTLDALHEEVADQGLVTAPGEAYSYSNAGYAMASRILEVVYDRPIHEVLDVQVFQPAGMVTATLERAPDSGMMYDGQLSEPGAVPGYNGAPDHLQQAYSKMYVIPGAGGVVASAQDAARFLHAVFEGGLVSDDMVREMTTSPFPQASDTYALGWIVGEARGEPAYGHSGGNNGFTAYFQYRRAEGVALVLLSNRGFTPLRDMLSEIRALLDA